MSETESFTRLRTILQKLDTMPYGIKTKHRIIPPNRHHFARSIDEICDILSHIDLSKTEEVLKHILSIRDNQVQMLLLNKDYDFNIYGVDEDMKQISQMIYMHLGQLISKH